MRYFVLFFVVCCVAVIGIAGRRGSHSRKPPIYVFPDMKRQLKLRPQTPNEFFANGTSSQVAPAGTIGRGNPLEVGGKLVYPFEDSPVWSGHAAGSTNFIENNPFPVTAQLLRRGQERFNIYCSPCHDRQGTGMGVVKKWGLTTIKSLHEPAVVKQSDGELFFVITNGRNTMQPYGPNIPVDDRWAIVAYVRALQLSHLASIDDVRPELRGNLKK